MISTVERYFFILLVIGSPGAFATERAPECGVVFGTYAPVTISQTSRTHITVEPNYSEILPALQVKPGTLKGRSKYRFAVAEEMGLLKQFFPKAEKVILVYDSDSKTFVSAVVQDGDQLVSISLVLKDTKSDWEEKIPRFLREQNIPRSRINTSKAGWVRSAIPDPEDPNRWNTLMLFQSQNTRAIATGNYSLNYSYQTVRLVADHLRANGVPEKILSIASESGQTPISLALLFPSLKLTTSDISPDAVLLTKLNAQLYGVQDRVTVVESDAYKSITGQYDLIVTSPPRPIFFYQFLQRSGDARSAKEEFDQLRFYRDLYDHEGFLYSALTYGLITHLKSDGTMFLMTEADLTRPLPKGWRSEVLYRNKWAPNPQETDFGIHRINRNPE